MLYLFSNLALFTKSRHAEVSSVIIVIIIIAAAAVVVVILVFTYTHTGVCGETNTVRRNTRSDTIIIIIIIITIIVFQCCVGL